VIMAVLEAALVELPIAVFCLLLARSVERRLAAAASLVVRRDECARGFDSQGSPQTSERAA
jgi:hypothetical protein